MEKHNQNMERGIKTEHKIIFDDSRNMQDIKDESIDLMITSPPYPMIKMWDKVFISQNEKIPKALILEELGDEKIGEIAFEEMHKELDKVWKETYRVLKNGGWACINIGDATRTIDGSFKVYPNHARIISACMKIGFEILPEIIWRKQSNKPNKFMGSGTLPAGAYVSQEHEYILILRKGNKREFKTDENKLIRQKSSYFFEERNKWFSDIWEDVKGDRQKLNNEELRERSASFPFELAYRLVNMFSVQGDNVLDPFLGTGTTMLACMSSERNSIGIEIDNNFNKVISERFENIVKFANEYNNEREEKHRKFIEKREEDKGEKTKYQNHKFPVVSRQEINIEIPRLKSINKINETLFEVEYN
jgi:DNA modification methylase